MDSKKNQGYFEEGSGLEYFKLYKDMINQYGIVTSAVFSLIANYSKYSMSEEKRCCTRSETSIGNELQISWSTVRKSIKILLDDKLIEKIDKGEISLEERLNSANWYRPISKNVYALKEKEKKPNLKANRQRQRYQESGREKIKENKEKRKKDKNNLENNSKNDLENGIKNEHSIVKEINTDNDQYSW